MKLYSFLIKGIIGIDYILENLIAELAIAREYDGIKLYIDSPGGYVDEANQMLKSLQNYAAEGKLIITENAGDVMSAAVQLFLTAEKGNRFFNPAKGNFLIHNPYMEFQTGDAAEFRRTAEELQKIEDSLAAFYANRTGANVNDIKQLMQVNDYLNAETIEALGFAIIKKTEEIKAVAYFNNLNNKKMEAVEKKLNLIEKILANISKKIVKALVIQDNQGNELDFGAEITDPSQIQVGVTATVGGQPANGDYVLPDGTTYRFENGTLIEIIEPQSNQIDELQKKVNELTEENEALKKQLEDVQKGLSAEVVELSKQLSEIKNLYKNYNAKPTTPSISNENNDGIRKIKFF